MNIDDMVPSKSNFLTKEDVGEAGKNLTIKGFTQEEVGFENNKELKYVVLWTDENYKPLVLNKENATRLKMILKTSDSTQMIGKTVNVYCDPFVKFGNEMKGGVRIRPVEHAQQQRPQQQLRQRQDSGWQETPPIEAYGDDDRPY